jgi:hypothetical protein
MGSLGDAAGDAEARGTEVRNRTVPSRGAAARRAERRPPESAPPTAPQTPLQAPVVASEAGLRTLFCCANELTTLLLAAERLARLAPALALPGGVEGAVVGRTLYTGALALRRIVRVERFVLAEDGGKGGPGGRLGRGGCATNWLGRVPWLTPFQLPPPPPTLPRHLGPRRHVAGAAAWGGGPSAAEQPVRREC